ncbi:hypothetical protein O3P69_015941 [Scylla paramamosain]|uniref:Peptidase S1 domain-containing protein n=1 Tax=Scylla paramamosain TaxID=85552 RepID=A0AAW0T915_SCYPA
MMNVSSEAVRDEGEDSVVLPGIVEVNDGDKTSSLHTTTHRTTTKVAMESSTSPTSTKGTTANQDTTQHTKVTENEEDEVATVIPDSEGITEAVPFMTLPDDHEGMSTLVSEGFDVTDALLDDVSDSSHSTQAQRSSSHLPPTTPLSQPTTPPRSTFAPRPAMFRPKPLRTTTSPRTPLDTTQTTLALTTPTVIDKMTSDGFSMSTLPTTTENTPDDHWATPETTGDVPVQTWTLSPQRPIMEIRPQTLPTTTTPEMTTTEENDDFLLFWTLSPQPPIANARPQTTTAPDKDDPFAFWTTKPPVQSQRPNTRIPDDLDPMLTWTTTSTARPQGLDDHDLYLEPVVVPGDVLQHITGDLLERHPNSTTTATSARPWASSTYTIHTIPYPLPSDNTIVQSGTPHSTTTVTTKTPTATTRRSKPPKRRKSTTTTSTTTPAHPFPSLATTTRPPPTTDAPISPIDQFIVDFINSSPPEEEFTTTTVTPEPPPPIDLELLTQLFNLTNIIPGEEGFVPPLPPLFPPTTTTTTTTTTPRPRPSTTTTRRRPKPRPTWNYRTTCGVRPLAREGRIVNGELSEYAEWPWQALVKESTWLGIFTKNKCGGVLLNRRYVLTAAHCQPGFLASLIVVLGEYDLSDDYEPKRVVQRNVKRVVVHRGYVAKTFDNDLALLEMERPVTYDEHIVPICMPKGNEDFVGQMGYVTGWGRLSYGGPVPAKLNEVALPVIENHECQQWFNEAGHPKKIKPEFFCAGYKEGRKDSCEGDSGGPLSIRGDDGRWILAGTVSHGIKCAYPNLPGVYMRMTYYKPWIRSIIN